MRRRRFLLNLAAPVAAIIFSVALSSIILLVAGHSPVTAFRSMWDYSLGDSHTRTSSLVSITNRAVPLYIAGLAVAMGFKMNLFNIGVEGQYRMAAILAAAAGAAVTLPAPLHLTLIILVAMAVGAAWAAIPAVLKVTRGVHEVISTIMLNTIATGVASYLLATYLGEKTGDLIPKTKELPKSGWMPDLNRPLGWIGIHPPVGSSVRGFLVVAVILGVLFWLVVGRTRFGFDLRASGVNPWAASASGIDAKGMVVRTMLLSGAVAGLIGISDVLGFFHRYTIDVPTGLGLTGIGVALLGRNHPVGVAGAAVLFAYLDRSAQILDLEGIPREIVVIMQGVILLSVVIAYEVVKRIGQAQEAKATAEATRQLDDEREPAGATA